jgi:hypothetical protein
MICVCTCLVQVLRVSPTDPLMYAQEPRFGPPVVLAREAPSATSDHADELWLADEYTELQSAVYAASQTDAIADAGYVGVQNPVTLKRENIPVRDWGGLCYMGWFEGLYPLNCLGEVRDVRTQSTWQHVRVWLFIYISTSLNLSLTHTHTHFTDIVSSSRPRRADG